MFLSSLRGGKAFTVEQKIRELKTRIAKLHSQKLKMSPKKIIEISTTNMNILPSKKYKFLPEEVEKKSIENKKFKAVYNMHRLEKTSKVNVRQDRYDKKSTIKREKN